MKTADSIERQEARKEAEKTRHVATQNSGPVSGRRGRVENLKPWPKGVSGNPGGKPRVDLAAEIARAIFANDGEAIYAAFSKALRKGSPYAFAVLSDRAFGKLKERVEIDRGPYADVSEADLQKRLRELETQLGIPHSEPEEEAPPISGELKPN